MPAKFSVAIPVHNRAEYLRSAIASCLAQTTDDLEVIVSDDCSTEDLESVASSFHDPRIKYYQSKNRLGAAANHQKAVSLSSGEYVIALNSDDMLLPNCLESAGHVLDANKGASAVFFSCTYLFGTTLQGCHEVPTIGFADKEILGANPWLEEFHGTGPSLCLFRRSDFDKIGGYRASLRLAYDWDIYMRFMSAGGGVVFHPHVLCVYRMHDEQMMQTSTINGLWDMLDLWQLNEYGQWETWKISEIALYQCIAALRNRKYIRNFGEVFRQINRRGLGWRVLSGLPRAVCQRILNRMASGPKINLSRYQRPPELETELQQADAALRALGL